ncbi:uncharacterized protein BCR38DRAFT_482526 [Pseudomassariella vexata]|uniref:Uncharacterized protein n=1 Tax=Pseudomassariella vexata TaxID=1141098 RepID=A0A1Y2EBU8_9PEZI|nr:uncharacterized protein BCR38DRAFT_482526 [Pseudomassariella vexata]ORY69053.1 hypothetical protein BCR38DRAFT_482526 [Pseudomassariella vexata]
MPGLNNSFQRALHPCDKSHAVLLNMLLHFGGNCLSAAIMTSIFTYQLQNTLSKLHLEEDVHITEAIACPALPGLQKGNDEETSRKESGVIEPSTSMEANSMELQNQDECHA